MLKSLTGYELGLTCCLFLKKTSWNLVYLFLYKPPPPTLNSIARMTYITWILHVYDYHNKFLKDCALDILVS